MRLECVKFQSIKVQCTKLLCVCNAQSCQILQKRCRRMTLEVLIELVPMTCLFLSKICFLMHFLIFSFVDHMFVLGIEHEDTKVIDSRILKVHVPSMQISMRFVFYQNQIKIIIEFQDTGNASFNGRLFNSRIFYKQR